MPLHLNWRVELHPVMVHFAVGLLCFAFLLDAIGGIWKSQSARLAGLYGLIGGAVGTVLSVVSGKITPEAQEREGGEALRKGGQIFAGFFSGRRVNVHEHWGYVLLVLVLLWLAMRLLAHFGKVRPGLVMSVGVLALIVLLVTGYKGGELVYGRRESGQLMNTKASVFVGAQCECMGGIGVCLRSACAGLPLLDGAQAVHSDGMPGREAAEPALGALDHWRHGGKVIDLEEMGAD